MFGKPQWFRPKSFGWGLTPITWEGWVYTLVWAVVLLGPFLWLLWRAGIRTASIVETGLIVVLLVDTWQILRAMKTRGRGE